MACIGNQTRPTDMRLHLLKEISGLPTSLNRRESSRAATSPDPVGESSSSGSHKIDASGLLAKYLSLRNLIIKFDF
ncbi:unnamed protein product [Arabidopsis arenosa]|uniref:Uncharacterized protein n=1 Tax=Arabidopsis arenosa TaxID=38785 RepID=A0A8S2AMX2_ARAAE|nr:unnamed protein product [Arabidopsis arenosa]